VTADHTDLARGPVGAAIERALGTSGLTQVGDGFGGIVFRTGSGDIVRVARTASAGRVHHLLHRVLPALAPRLPIAIPIPGAVLPPSGALPFGALVYPALPGTVASAARMVPAIAHQLATFLVALHGIDPAGYEDVPDHVDDRARWRAIRAATLPACEAHLDARERRILDAWWDRFLDAPERRRFVPALCHGDPWYENILLDDAGDRITGVLDWEAIAIGDPARDLSPLRYAGDAFADAVVNHYVSLSPRSDPLLGRRVRWFWEAGELDGLRLAMELDDAEEIADAIGKIRRGPILHLDRDGG